MADDQSINVSQLILVVLLGGIAIRYFFFSPAQSPARNAANSASQLRAREADVERIQQMFPQISRRTIMWDLQRNGGSVAATTERILSGRGLDEPPQTFQPPMPASSSSPSNASASTSAPKAVLPDLITRYNLSSKISAPEEPIAEASGTTSKSKQSWSANKVERQTLLQQRREEMILAARRKMEAKLKAEEAQKGTTT